MSKKIAIIGGDLRQLAMGEALEKDGYDVTLFGFDQTNLWPGAKDSKLPEDALEDAKIVVLGLPVSIDNVTINTPCSNNILYIDEFFQKIDKSVLLIGGRISKEFLSLCEYHEIKVVDYILREDLSILNAIPTAEGAIGIAMEETACTIHGCKCLITGFGRIGKMLAHYLHCMGADVSCSARKTKDLAWIRAYNCTPKNTNDLKNYVHEYTVIFNTVPSKIFTRDILRNVRSDAVIIDLASKPGGIDFGVAKELGINTIWALSLPGKVAPLTAGIIIKDTVVNIINEF